MELSRYAISDAYILEELRREYQASDARGRIRILRKLSRGDRTPPFEITLMAVEDTHVEVRQWVARHAKSLDYRELGHVEGQVVYQFPERNLADRLRNDPDPFVRACLLENSPVTGGLFGLLTDWEGLFLNSSHLERLALVRNPKVGAELIERIFDPDDTKLGIDLVARKELVLAFLTNTQALGQSRQLDPYYFSDGFDWYKKNKHFSQLWTLVAKWPRDHGIRYMTYQYVGATDETKAEAYQTSDDPVLRQVILGNCDGRDSTTIELGMRDTDDWCRRLAYARVRRPNRVIEAVLQGEDDDALSGMAENRSLSVGDLEKVRDRLSELGHDDDAWGVRRVVEQAEKTQPPKDPEELFGYEGRRGSFLEDKIDFIGKKLLEVSEQLAAINEGTRQLATSFNKLKDTVVWAIIVGAVVVILLAMLFR